MNEQEKHAWQSLYLSLENDGELHRWWIDLYSEGRSTPRYSYVTMEDKVRNRLGMYWRGTSVDSISSTTVVCGLVYHLTKRWIHHPHDLSMPPRFPSAYDELTKYTKPAFDNSDQKERDTVKEQIKPQVEDNTMNLEITHKTFINGKDVAEYTNDDIQKAIIGRSKRVADLSAVAPLPKALQKEIADLRQQIVDLVTILNDHFDESAEK